jgi:protease IV
VRSIHPFFKQIIKLVVFIFSGVSTFVLSFVMIFFLLLVFVAALAASADGVSESQDLKLEHVFGEVGSSNRLVSLKINGLILGDKGDTSPLLEFLSEFGVVYGYEIKDTLIKLADDDSIQGVVLEINSPGGTIFGTQAIVDGVAEYKQRTGKPVLAFVGSMAASGGYWAAASADEILADTGTAIGSIGVVMGPIKYYDQVISESGGAFMGGVETRGGIETEYITAGFSKDLGNPYRRLTDRERQALQVSVDNYYNLFVSYVAEQRDVSETLLRSTVGALILDEGQAISYGLVDQRANKQEAFSQLARLANLPADDFEVLQQKRRGGFFNSLTDAAAAFSSGSNKPAAYCSLSTTVLAFHGNVAALCPR